ncbi:hypothetical protein SAP269_16700 [Spiroplasma ixodetis]|uniref:Uncharacterized protein n=1 Tax=Spiroplasma ixodetis TaxID=2141 RepID=A0ABM8JNZ6_9MOLU
MASGAVTGITIFDTKFKLEAAKATPCGWLPALAAIKPFACCSFDKLRIVFKAPLILKLPVFCKFSNFKNILLPEN